ncbi:MAG: HGGxSTG domain-containing protein [Armatimonadota bacterium]
MAGKKRTKGDRDVFLVDHDTFFEWMKAEVPEWFGGDKRPPTYHYWRYLSLGIFNRSRYMGTITRGPKKHPAKKDRPLCGAATRQGTPCRMGALPGKSRCTLHGGKSTGPKTAEGKARIAESNRRRAQEKRSALSEPEGTHL